MVLRKQSLLGLGVVLSIAGTVAAWPGGPKRPPVSNWNPVEASGTAQPEATSARLVPSAPAGEVDLVADVSQTTTRERDQVGPAAERRELVGYACALAGLGIVRPLALAAREPKPELRITTRVAAGRNAIGHVLAGGGGFAVVCVEPSRNEFASGITQVILGHFVPALVTSVRNPTRNLTAPQMRSILRGTAHEWSEFGWNTSPIRILCHSDTQKPGPYAAALLVGDQLAAVQPLPDASELISRIAAEPASLGLLSSTLLRGLPDNVAPVSIEGVPPSELALRNGSDRPCFAAASTMAMRSAAPAT